MRRLLSCLVLTLALGLPATAAAAPRTEQPLPQTDPQFPDVVRTLVALEDPLPAAANAPAACDTLTYVRYRSRSGPVARGEAEATLVALPGGLAGGGSLMLQALKVVQDAADRGRAVEVWTLDRRPNCLEDRRGLLASRASGTVETGLDYYYRGGQLDGRRFAGFLESRQVPFMADQGLKPVLEDWRTVLLSELPDVTYRRTRTFCTGHSFGGTIAGLLLAWDFDDDPATREDAGYNLCAGTVALDSSTDFNVPSPVLRAFLSAGLVDVLRASQTQAATVGLLRAGALPRIFDVGFISPEVLGLLTGLGLNAGQRPDADVSDLIAQIPTDSDAQLAMRFFASPTLADALAPVPKLRRQQVTGQTAFGLFVDDDTQQVPFAQLSLGSIDGPVVASRFPTAFPGYFLPERTDVLYGWNTFREPQNRYTTPRTEVTDVDDLARVSTDEGADLVDWYLPTRLLFDLLYASVGNREGDLSHIRYVDAARLRPRLTTTATEGLGLAPRPVRAGVPSQRVLLPGYNHLDAVLAAQRQRDGSRERSASAVVSFVLRYAGRTWPAVPPADPGARSPAASAAALQAVARKAAAGR